MDLWSRTPPTWDLAHNPGMYPDCESTGGLLLFRGMPNQLSHTSQGRQLNFLSCESITLRVSKMLK